MVSVWWLIITAVVSGALGFFWYSMFTVSKESDEEAANVHMRRTLEQRIASCRECHGQREYNVLVGDGWAHERAEMKRKQCGTCDWIQRLLAEVEVNEL